MIDGALVLATVTGVDGAATVVDVDGQPGRIPPADHNWLEGLVPGMAVWCVVIAAGEGGPPLLSRTHDALVRGLLERHCPAIARGEVAVVRVARRPGAKAKIAVTAGPGADPIRLCLADGDAWLERMVTDLADDSIDLVPFDTHPGRFLCDALAPLEIVKLVIDDEHQVADVIVGDHALEVAFGDRSTATHEVELASRLTGWRPAIWDATRYDLHRRTRDPGIRPLIYINPPGTPGFEPPPDLAAVIERAQQAQRLAAILGRHVEAAGLHIEQLAIAVSGPVATITGMASTPADRDAAERIVRASPEIESVNNAIDVRG